MDRTQEEQSLAMDQTLRDGWASLHDFLGHKDEKKGLFLTYPYRLMMMFSFCTTK